MLIKRILFLYLLITSLITYGKSKEEIISQYQKNGLTLARVAGVPDQKFGGFLIQAIYNTLKIPVKIEPLPGKRALLEANKGIVDGESIRMKKIQKLAPNLILVSPHISMIEGSAFTKKKININGWKSLRKYTIGIVRGIQYAADGTSEVKNRRVLDSGEALMRSLSKDRIDIAITAKFNGRYLLKKLKLEDEILIQSPPLVVFKLYHYLHKKHQELVPIIEEQIWKLKKNGTLSKLQNIYKNKIFND